MGLETKDQIKAAIASGRTQITNDLGIILPNILTAMLDSYVDFPNKNAVSVTDPAFGAVGDGVSDNSAAFANAIAAVQAKSGNTGGVVYVPSGFYIARSGVTVPMGVWLIGAGANSTIIHDGGANLAPVITMTGGSSRLSGIQVWGCGVSGSTEPLPTYPAVSVFNVGDWVFIDHCIIVYGNICLDIVSSTVFLDTTDLGFYYGSRCIHVGNGAELHAAKTMVLQDYPAGNPAPGTVYPPNWLANHVYAVGQTAFLSSPQIISQVVAVTGDARSGSVIPNNSSAILGINIIDNHVTWQNVFYNSGAQNLAIDGNSENHNELHQCQFNAPSDTNIFINNPLATLDVTNCKIFGGTTSAIGLSAAKDVKVTASHLSAWSLGSACLWAFGTANVETLLVSNCYLNGFTFNNGMQLEAGVTSTVFSNNRFSGTPVGLAVTAGVGNFNASNNSFSGGTPLQVPAGASNHYIFANNLLGGGTISDGGSGANKTITGNV